MVRISEAEVNIILIGHVPGNDGGAADDYSLRDVEIRGISRNYAFVPNINPNRVTVRDVIFHDASGADRQSGPAVRYREVPDDPVGLARGDNDAISVVTDGAYVLDGREKCVYEIDSPVEIFNHHVADGANWLPPSILGVLFGMCMFCGTLAIGLRHMARPQSILKR